MNVVPGGGTVVDVWRGVGVAGGAAAAAHPRGGEDAFGRSPVHRAGLRTPRQTHRCGIETSSRTKRNYRT